MTGNFDGQLYLDSIHCPGTHEQDTATAASANQYNLL